MQQHAGPPHSIGRCPICEAGLCGVRICTGDDPLSQQPTGGFILCDECEALWLEPNTASEHSYVDPENPSCPICRGALWSTSRWALQDDIKTLGWSGAVDPDLDITPGQV